MSLDDNIGKTISDIKKEKQNPIDSITVKKYPLYLHLTRTNLTHVN